MTVTTQLAIAGSLTAALAAVSIPMVVSRYRRNPDQRERERRLAVNRHGRLADGIITDANEDALYYTCTLNGVTYTESQEIRQLRAYLPPETTRIIGPVTLKYTPRNPANSIVLCEEWSGLRTSTSKELKLT